MPPPLLRSPCQIGIVRHQVQTLPDRSFHVTEATNDLQRRRSNTDRAGGGGQGIVLSFFSIILMPQLQFQLKTRQGQFSLYHIITLSIPSGLGT